MNQQRVWVDIDSSKIQTLEDMKLILKHMKICVDANAPLAMADCKHLLKEELNMTRPDMEEAALEQKINDEGLNAPRVKPVDLDTEIANVQYHVFDGSQLTVCCITLKNGFTVTGESACVSPENFRKHIGEEISFKHARDKIWQFLGFRMREKLAADEDNLAAVRRMASAGEPLLSPQSK